VFLVLTDDFFVADGGAHWFVCLGWLVG